VRQRIGRLQHADRGTLFLDEIETLPAEAQGKFLRVLEEREVTPLGGNTVRTLDVRIVAAAKGDLGEAVRKGLFRQDLFHRLDVVRLRIPPLRERRDDVPLLFGHFLARAGERFGRPTPQISDAVRWRLLHHDWPGNVRELDHFAQRVALQVDDGQPSSLGEPASVSVSLPERLAAYETHLIEETLANCRGDVRSALEALGIPRKTFYDKLERHGIDINAFRVV
jgi:two-component system C4-dicarboxylate transport response regulator DctD